MKGFRKNYIEKKRKIFEKILFSMPIMNILVCNVENKKEEELKQEIEDLKKQIEKLKSKKKYGIVWDDKRDPEKVVLQCNKKIPILVEDKNKVINGDKKRYNVLIEGDNYHALCVLSYTHSGMIDVIYIDPPYNTGKANEWKYNDKYVDKEDEYRHSKWLNMMEKRLRLARKLLSNNGVIFISIDDNEVAQLKLLCDEIFGENNRAAIFNWKSRSSLQYSEPLVSSQTEYVLMYCKNKNKWGKKLLKLNKVKKETDGLIYSNPDKDPLGKWTSSGLIRDDGRKKYKIVTPSGKEHVEAWLYTKENMDKFEKENILWFGEKGDALPRKKSYWKDYKGRTSSNLLKDEFIFFENENGIIKKKKLFTIGTTEAGTKELKEIFNDKRTPFDYPKPHTLIKYFLSLYPKKDLISLDFFAGSGTTGHAVLALNKEDGGNRKFILCTNNEGKICTDVCYPRLKKVIDGYTKPNNTLEDGLGGSLKYYKTDFVDINSLEGITDEEKLKITYRAGEMIAVKEDTLNEVETTDYWQIFSNGKKTTAIYFRENISKIYELVESIKEDKKVILYIFGWGKNEYVNEFIEYENIEVRDIPEPIIEVYRGVNKL
jgi:adenine-specific DNA-methyltransferase